MISSGVNGGKLKLKLKLGDLGRGRSGGGVTGTGK